MGDEKRFQKNFKSMSALGRNFKLGDLYNYRNDLILPGIKAHLSSSISCGSCGGNLFIVYITDHASMVWKPNTSVPVSRVLDFTSEWTKCSAEAEFSNKIKTDNMDLDNHLLASTMCGLIGDFKGASKFINDKPDPSQVTITCNWTQKLWVERHKDLPNLTNKNIAHCHTVNTKTNSEATHVVVSVLYGAQMFCVFAQDVKGKEEDEQVRKETQEKLSKIMKTFQVAFDKQLNPENFIQEFSQEEKHELADLKCRLYMDLRKESVYECNIFEAYGRCIDLKRQLSKVGPIDVNKLKGVPIAIQLCPLQVLLPSVLTSFGPFRDVSYDLVKRYCRILADSKRIMIRAEKMYTAGNTEETCPAVGDFVHLVSKYQHFLQENWKKAIVLARSRVDHYLQDGEIISIVNIAENHPLFLTSQLELWIDSKVAEMGMMQLIVSTVGTKAVVLTDTSQLTKLVNKKNALVLTVPPLDEQTNETLDAMKKSFDENFQSGKTTNVHKSWYMVQSKKELVLTYLTELETHLKRNNEESSQIKFFITFGGSGKPFGCSYSVYEKGKLLKNYLLRLPSPPSGLRIVHPVTQKTKKAKTTFSSVNVKWNYEVLGFPCNFTVQSRQKGTSDRWISWKTIKNTKSVQNQLTIDYLTGAQMEFRIAANTCIGSSDYSDIIDGSVSEVNWSPAQENNKIFLRPPTYLKVNSFIGFFI